MKIRHFFAGILTMALVPAANAALLQFEKTNVAFGNGAQADSIFAQYDTDTSVMTWTTDNLTRNGNLADGFWLVTNDGPDNPKGSDGLAIFYADFNANSLWAFGYNGQNNPASYTSTEYLGDFSAGIINAGTTRGFSIDVSSIYGALPTSAPFGEEIGVWFHGTWGTQTQTNQDGRLVNWSFRHQAWYDRAGLPTEIIEPDPDPVPAPATLSLILMGLLGLRRLRAAS